MDGLDLIKLLHENGIDITNSFISICRIDDDKTCEEDTVLITTDRGTIKNQFSYDELFPENSGQQLRSTYLNVVEKHFKTHLPPHMSPLKLAAPERVSSRALTREGEKSKTEERCGSAEIADVFKNSAQQTEVRKRKLSISDDDCIFMGNRDNNNSINFISQMSASKRHKGLGDQKPTFQDKIGETILTYPNKVHDCLNGDFVIDRADMYKMDIIRIWKISGNNMLERYDAISEETNVFKSTNRFTKVKDNLSNQYAAIQVRRRDDKNVVFKNRISPEALNECLDGTPFMEVFSIYFQSIVGQCISGDFFQTIKAENSKYFLDSLDHIDSILEDARNEIAAQAQWNLVPHFQEALDHCPYYSVAELIASSPEHLEACQVSNDTTITATKCFNLHGLQYLKENLRTVSRCRNFTFFLSDSALTMAMNYHAIRHFKYHLFKDAEKDVALRLSSGNFSEVDILNELINNRPRIRHFYGHLVKILMSCGLDVFAGQH